MTLSRTPLAALLVLAACVTSRPPLIGIARAVRQSMTSIPFESATVSFTNRASSPCQLREYAVAWHGWEAPRRTKVEPAVTIAAGETVTIVVSLGVGQDPDPKDLAITGSCD